MEVQVILEPPGVEADEILTAWRRDRQLIAGAGGLLGLDPKSCLEALADLRARCYDRGLTVNANFGGGKER